MARMFVVLIGYMMEPKVHEAEVEPTDNPRNVLVRYTSKYCEKVLAEYVHETRRAAVEYAKKLTVRQIGQRRRELKRLTALRDKWTKELKQKGGA